MEAESKSSAPLEVKHATGHDSELVYTPIFGNFLSLICLNIITPPTSRPCKCISTRLSATKFSIISPPYPICENRNIQGFTFVTKLSNQRKTGNNFECTNRET